MVKVQDKDFIEVKFTGIIKNTGKVFDTSDTETAKKEGIFNENQKYQNLKVCVGQGVAIKGLDEAFLGKEISKKYEIEIKPENSFGKRNKDLIKVISMKVFREKNINPRPGMFFDLNNMVARIASVSGGRVIIDFNHPLASKVLIYKFKVVRKIEDIKEKAKILFDFFSGFKNLKINYDIEVKDKKVVVKFKDKISLEMIEKSGKLKEVLKKKFKEVLSLDLEFSIDEERKEKSKPERKEKSKPENKE